VSSVFCFRVEFEAAAPVKRCSSSSSSSSSSSWILNGLNGIYVFNSDWNIGCSARGSKRSRPGTDRALLGNHLGARRGICKPFNPI
jgi:hypothetical protein